MKERWILKYKVEIAPNNITSVRIPTAVTASSFKTAETGSNEAHLISTFVSNIEGSSTEAMGVGKRLIVSMSQLPVLEDISSGDFTNLPVGSVFVVGGSGGVIIPAGGSIADGVELDGGQINRVIRHLGIVTKA